MIDEANSARATTPGVNFNRVISNIQSKNLRRGEGQASVPSIKRDSINRLGEIEQIRRDRKSQNANQVSIDSNISQTPLLSKNEIQPRTLETSRTDQIDLASLGNNRRETNTIIEEVIQREVQEKQAESETGNNVDRFA